MTVADLLGRYTTLLDKNVPKTNSNERSCFLNSPLRIIHIVVSETTLYQYAERWHVDCS